VKKSRSIRTNLETDKKDLKHPETDKEQLRWKISKLSKKHGNAKQCVLTRHATQHTTLVEVNMWNAVDHDTDRCWIQGTMWQPTFQSFTWNVPCGVHDNEIATGCAATSGCF